MQYRRLGATEIEVSEIAFGAGPVPALFTRDGQESAQRQSLQRALELGINWIDTAATYGEGKSEANLGNALRDIQHRSDFHVATKVRLVADQLSDIRGTVLRSCEASLARLHRSSITLLQLHNSVTARREDQPTSITPQDVLGRNGVLDAMQELQRAGMVRHIGLTGLGDASSMIEVMRSGAFQTVQTPYNVLNPSAGQIMPAEFKETNYGNQFAECARQSMGVFAIRVYAGGALVGQAPSAHTKQTRFFPLDLYQRDAQRAADIGRRISPGQSLSEMAVRFVLHHPAITSAIIGFSSPAQVEEAVQSAAHGPLSDEDAANLH